MTQKKILIVEDDHDILITLQELLELEGYVANMASHGLAALKYLKTANPLPDLIILDYMMPEMDGAEFRVEQLKDPRIAGIPVFLVTADGQPDQKQLKIGAKVFMKKPLDLTRFLEAVAKCLE